jgi:hypothetical protein
MSRILTGESLSRSFEEIADAGTLYPSDFVIPSGSTVVTQAISSVSPTLRLPNGADTLVYASLRVLPSWSQHYLGVTLEYTSNVAAGNSFTISLRLAGANGTLISSYPSIGSTTLTLAEPGVVNTPVVAAEYFFPTLPVTPAYRTVHLRVGRTVTDSATGNFELLEVRWRVTPVIR